MIEIPIGGAKANGRVALIDDEDYELVGQSTWHIWLQTQNSENSVDCGPYARSGKRFDGRKMRMHILIMGRPYIDHVDGNGLNNQRGNLRPATRSQNNWNRRRNWHGTSQYKGVTWNKRRVRWVAQISHEGRRLHLGAFHDELEAAIAYDAAARDLFGEYARPNFPLEAA